MGAVADECTTHNPSYAEHVAVAATWNPSKRNHRGGACVPARMFEQWRFHTKTGFVHHALYMGMNDGCVYFK